MSSSATPVSPSVRAASMRAMRRRSTAIAIQGWLSKRAISGTFKNWRERYFVLKGLTLEYRKDEKGDARGSISIDAETKVEVYPDFGDTCFAVTLSSGTVLYAKAENKESMHEWIAAIHLASTCPPKALFFRRKSSGATDVPAISPADVAPGHPGNRPMSVHLRKRNSDEKGDLVKASSRRLLHAHTSMQDMDDMQDTALPSSDPPELPSVEEEKEEEDPKPVKIAVVPSVESFREDERCKKYVRMMKMHIPVAAICMKMETSGDFNADEIDAFRNDKPCAQKSFREDERCKKYVRMMKMHIPVAAICMKMEASGDFISEEIEAFRNDKHCLKKNALQIEKKDSDTQHMKDRHENRGAFVLSDAIKFGAMRRKAKKGKKIKLKRSVQRVFLGKLHNIRARARENRLREVKKRERKASVFRPVVALAGDKDGGDTMEPEDLARHIKKFGVKTRTDALNYDRSLKGCPSGSRKASCVCRSNPNCIFLYRRRHPAFPISREDVQNDIDLMKECTNAGLKQLPLVYTDVFDAMVDDFETFGFLMGNVPSLMTAPYKPGTSHAATVNNIHGRLKLLNFTQLNRAIKDLEEIGEFTKTKYYIHDLQMLLQDEGPPDEIGHIWVIDPGELQKSKGKNQVYKLLKLCRSLKRLRTKSIVRFMKVDPSEEEKKKE